MKQDNLINNAEKKAVQKQRDYEPAQKPALPARRSRPGRLCCGRTSPPALLPPRSQLLRLAHRPGETCASPVPPPAQGEPLATRGNSASLPSFSRPRGRISQGLSPADSEADQRPRGPSRPVEPRRPRPPHAAPSGSPAAPAGLGSAGSKRPPALIRPCCGAGPHPVATRAAGAAGAAAARPWRAQHGTVPLPHRLARPAR